MNTTEPGSEDACGLGLNDCGRWVRMLESSMVDALRGGQETPDGSGDGGDACLCLRWERSAPPRDDACQRRELCDSRVCACTARSCARAYR